MAYKKLKIAKLGVNPPVSKTLLRGSIQIEAHKSKIVIGMNDYREESFRFLHCFLLDMRYSIVIISFILLFKDF